MDYEKAKREFQLLITEGYRFTDKVTKTDWFSNIKSVTPEWTIWLSRVEALAIETFGDQSTYARMLSKNYTNLIGGYYTRFDFVKSYILTVLQECLSTLEKGDISLVVSNKVPRNPKKIFIVHGHDENAKIELEIFLHELGLEPIVLHRLPDTGYTIIEKFEAYSDVGYAFILLTPDEVAYLASQEKVPDSERKKETRARPNVIFEWGYFVGKLGRRNVCCLYRGDVALPSDLHGLIYKKFDKSIEEIGYTIIKELKAAGYQLKS